MKRSTKINELRKIIDSEDGDKVINDIFDFFEKKKCMNCKFSKYAGDIYNNDLNKFEDRYLCELLDNMEPLREDFSCDSFVVRKDKK